MMNGMFGGMWFGWLFWIVLIIVVVWIITRITSNNQTNYTKPDNNKEDALDILKKRYAKGEISKEQFDEMKKDLLNS